MFSAADVSPSLTFIILWANLANETLIINFLFLQKTIIGSSCKSFSLETVCKKYQNLSSGKKMSPAENFTECPAINYASNKEVGRGGG